MASKLGAICGALIAAAALAMSSAPAEAQINVQSDGPYLHKPADAVFPVQVGGFQRAAIHRYDSKGRDVSANYNLITPEGRLLVTVYIYPAPKIPGRGDGKAIARASTCAQHFSEVNQTIAGQHGGARPTEEGAGLAVPGVDPALSHRSAYRYDTYFGDHVQPVKSEAHLYCYVGDNWLVKYRVTTPAAVDTKPVNDFIRAGPWPGRGSPESIAATGAGGEAGL
jgi:hypothetical protein